MYTVGLDVDTIVSIWAGNSPENIGLFAGNFLEIQFTYSTVVEKIWILLRTFLFKKEQSAGNYFWLQHSLESFQMAFFISKDVVQKRELLSEHRPPHKKPTTPEELGAYLAGLIEGDGYFGNKSLEIVLHKDDIDLVYRVKRWVGFGNVYKIKDKNVVKYVLRHKVGLTKVIELTNGHWVGFAKLEQLKKQELDKWTGIQLKEPSNLVDLESFWTAGFMDADGTLNVFIETGITHKCQKRPQIQIRVKQKTSLLPLCLKRAWGGNLCFCKDQCFTWSLTNIISRNNKELYYWFKFIDLYPLQSTSKYVQYVLLRKAFLLMQSKQHLNKKGLEKIQKLNKLISGHYVSLKKLDVHPKESFFSYLTKIGSSETLCPTPIHS